MITTAIIAEFNPFHKGHEYIIQQTRRLTCADCIVIIMSGNFTQRGDIAIAPKHVRAGAALACGADLVIELPFAYATSSAEGFAMGAVSALNSLGFVDYLAFGSECGSISVLNSAALILADEPAPFRELLQESLKAGMPYPAAREKAFLSVSGGNIPPDLFKPNNILAIEYIKAIIKTKSAIKPITIKRQGASFDDESYSPDKGFISAGAFRAHADKLFNNNSGFDSFLDSTLPEVCSTMLKSAAGYCFPIVNDDLMPSLRYSLLTNRNFLTDFADFTPALANRLVNRLKKQGNDFLCKPYEEFVLQLKTRELTATHIKRALLHVLCSFTSVNASHALDAAYEGRLPFLRLIGINNIGQAAIKENRKLIDTMLINSLGKSIKDLSGFGRELISFDITSSDLYAMIVYNKFGYILKDEYRQDIIR